MLESEQKRKRLTDLITHWCEHTNVLPYLRDYDIPSLVGQVMEEFYQLRCTCGHSIRDFDEGVHIAFKDMNDGEEVEVSGLYCKDCAERYKKNLGAWEVKDA